MPTSQTPLKVLIVDDSSASRAMLRSIIESDPGLSVMAAAPDAFAAAKIMRSALPDVMLLDLELPEMDGLTFLQKIMAQRPLPVVVCSGHTAFGSEKSFAALEAGAVEVILKPAPRDAAGRQEATIRVVDAIYAAAQSRSRAPVPAAIRAPGPKLSADEILPPPNLSRPTPDFDPVVCIGASTGGTEALRIILEMLPLDAPAIAVVQHMPEGFTNAFARRMNMLCPLEVFEAADGQSLKQGQVVIAAGDHHMLLRRTAESYRIRVTDGPYVSRHRPSVDVLFRSAAGAAAQNAMGIILTGMGDDGARCLGEMRQAGSPTLAQDEASCVVYGMPREAVVRGAVVQTLPLDKIAAAIMAFARRRRLTGAGK